MTANFNSSNFPHSHIEAAGHFSSDDSFKLKIRHDNVTAGA
jgi:hypothetical protein